MTTVSGPLGIWPWPLVNLLMKMLDKKGSQGTSRTPMLPAPRANIVSNTEKITWTDWKGRVRHINIEREVK